MAKGANAGSMYIVIDGDTSKFEQSVRSLQKQAKVQGQEIGNAFGVGFNKPITDSLSKLNRNIANTFGAMSLKNITLPTDKISGFAKELGIADDTYKSLAERMVKNDANMVLERSFKNIAESAQLTKKEMQGLAKEMGLSDAQFKKVAASMGKQQNDWTVFAKRIAAATISVTALKGAFGTIISSLQDISQAGEQASAMGLSIENFSRLKYVVEASGVSVSTFASAWQDLQKNMSSAAGGDKTRVDAFKELGLSLSELNTQAPVEQLKAISDAISRIDSQGRKVDLVGKLFGQGGGKEFLKVLSQGSEGVDALSKRFDELGGGVNGFDAAKARKTTNAVNDLGHAWSNLSSEIALFASPAIIAGAESLTNIIAGFNNSDKKMLDLALPSEMAKMNVMQLEYVVASAKKTFDELYDIQNQITETEWGRGYHSAETGFLSATHILDQYSLAAIRLTEAQKNLKKAQDSIVKQPEIPQILPLDSSFGDVFKDVDALRIKLTSAIPLAEVEKFKQGIKDTLYIDPDIVAIDKELTELINRAGELGLTYNDEFATLLVTLSEVRVKALEVKDDLVAPVANLSTTGEIIGGLYDGIDRYIDYMGTLQSNISNMVTSSFIGMENALADFVTKGKLDFNSLANSIIEDLIRIAIRQAIMRPLLGGLGFDIAHTGGVVGSLSQTKNVSPLVFAGAPKYHGGGYVGSTPLAHNEVPIIAQKGELVLTPAQQKVLSAKQQAPQVNVQVINNTTAQATIQQQSDGSGGVNIKAVIDDAVAASVSRRGSRAQQALRNATTLVGR